MRFRPATLALALFLPAGAVPGQDAAPPGRAAVPAYRQANTVAVLTVHGPIDKVTLRSLERRVTQALDDGAEAIVLDIDTPGGALEPTLDICHLIRTEAPANTVAWINPKAYSAGTIIALASREIVVAPDASFGDAAPVSPFGPIPATERAKVESPILAEVVHSARRNHYDEKLVQAFVSVGVELWLIEHQDTGERIFVDREEFKRVFGDEPPTELTPVAPPAGARQDKPVKPWFESMMPTPEGFESEPIGPDELQRQIELEQVRPSSRRRLTRADRGDWAVVRQVVSSDRLLTLKPDEAGYYGLATATIADDEQLRRYFGASTIKRYDRAWSESLVQFLTHPVVMGVLIVIFVICLLIELSAPGTGAFGVTAGAALLIMVGAPWLAGMAQWWEILLIVAGLCLVGMELFIVPGFGFVGLAGAACLLVGLIGTFVSGDLASPAGQAELIKGIAAVFTALFASGVGAWFLFKQFETMPLFARIILKTEVAGGPPGGQQGLLESMGTAPGVLAEGAVGVAETALRPSGRVNFDGRLVDVKSVGAYIERGARVRVVSVGRFAIEVEEADA